MMNDNTPLEERLSYGEANVYKPVEFHRFLIKPEAIGLSYYAIHIKNDLYEIVPYTNLFSGGDYVRLN